VKSFVHLLRCDTFDSFGKEAIDCRTVHSLNVMSCLLKAYLSKFMVTRVRVDISKPLSFERLFVVT
jgi:hypothetical protein